MFRLLIGLVVAFAGAGTALAADEPVYGGKTERFGEHITSLR